VPPPGQVSALEWGFSPKESDASAHNHTRTLREWERLTLMASSCIQQRDRWQQQATEAQLRGGSNCEAAAASFADNHPWPSSGEGANTLSFWNTSVFRVRVFYA